MNNDTEYELLVEVEKRRNDTAFMERLAERIENDKYILDRLSERYAEVPEHVIDKNGDVWRVVRDGGMLTRAHWGGIVSIGIETARIELGPLDTLYRKVK